MFPRDPKLEKDRRCLYAKDFMELFDDETLESENVQVGENAGKNSVEKAHLRFLINIKEEEGTSLIWFKYGLYELIKHPHFDMFYYQNIVNIIENYNSDITDKSIETFINSYNFYQQLCLLDHDLPKYSNVYLLQNKEKKTFKVGMSWNYKKRYSKDKRDKETVFVVPVHNASATENKLIKAMRKLCGEPIEGTEETFNYTNFTDIKSLFNETIESDRVKVKFNANRHFARTRNETKYKGLWVSEYVLTILLSYYIEESEKRKEIFEFLNMIRIAIDKDVYVENIDSTKKYIHIIFHKYSIIQVGNYINGSALYNSICKADNVPRKYDYFSHFMKSEAMKVHIKQYKEMEDNDDYMHLSEYRNPLLRGYMVHYTFVHSIMENLSAWYYMHVSKLMYRLMLVSGGIELPDKNELDSYFII